jgi:hypothetical protein
MSSGPPTRSFLDVRTSISTPFKAWYPDIAIVVVLFMAACAVGGAYFNAFRAAGGFAAAPGFNQGAYGAALMSACGRGLRTPILVPSSDRSTSGDARSVADFLEYRRERISCGEIPAAMPVADLDGLQRASRYLLLLLSLAFRIFGTSWKAIATLAALLYGTSAACVYLVSRLAMGRMWSAGVALAAAVSPLELSILPDVRDYSKAPFFLCTLCLAGLMVRRPLRPVSVLLVAAAGGLLLGIGFGIRTDIAVYVVILVLAALFVPFPPRTAWGLRLGAATLCLTTFFIAASPIIMSLRSSSNIGHWALLGFAEEFDVALGIEPTPYQLGYVYSDSYVATVVNAFAGRAHGVERPVLLDTPDYGNWSREYYLLLVRTFPADVLLRGWASVRGILNLPFHDAVLNGASTVAAPAVAGVPLSRALSWRARALARFDGAGVALFAVTLLAMSAYQFGLSTFVLILVSFLGAYPSIQYQRRHFFQLEVVGLWLCAMVLSRTVSWVRRFIAPPQRRPNLHLPSHDEAVQMVLMAVLSVSLVVVPLWILRLYQQRTGARLLASYEEADRIDLPLDPVPADEGRVRVGGLVLGRNGEMRPRSVHSNMVAIDLAAACDARRMPLTFRYVASDPLSDFSQTVEIALPVNASARPVRVFFPAYDSGATNPDPRLLRFAGIELADRHIGCVKSLALFRHPDRFPLLLETVLPGDWTERPLHERLVEWRSVRSALAGAMP